ncbi:hypothetical protein ACIP5U_34080 [Streptomyces sp. NPDC088788]
MSASSPPLREAARAVLLDPEQRVLLLRYDENGGFWATPADHWRRARPTP